MTADDLIQQIENDEELQEKFTEAFIADVASQIELLDAVKDSNEILTLVKNAISMGGDAHETLAFLLGVPEVSDWLIELVQYG